MNVIIIEDESRAANRLEKMLLAIQPNIQILNKLETVEESILYLNSNISLDLIFSDIQLADGLCFEIYDQVSVNCPIIFTTAFDNYAIKAFKTNGIDYLLKPIDEPELLQSIQKAKSLTQNNAMAEIQLLANALRSQQKSYKSRFMVKVGDKITSVPTDDIHAFYSFEKSTFLLTKEGRKFIVEFPLDYLVTQLNPNLFFKVNRKFIIPIHVCENIISYSNSRLQIRLDTLPNEKIIVAREKVQQFKQWLDG